MCRENMRVGGRMRIELKQINKKFGKDFEIKDFNLTISDGSFTTFLGPSGCGKTTILRMISGLETPDSGEIWFDERCIYSSEKGIDLPAEKRNLGFVFQDFALWPHMTVYENVALGLRARKQTDGLEAKVMCALKAVQLESMKNRQPSQLSGGQQQRVAFARAIVASPQCILFDEPLSALDAILRDEMRIEIKRLTEHMGITSVFVTHDQMEAMSMSDRIVVLNQGYIEQHDLPEKIYQAPATRFVASFIGKSNWIDKNSMFRPEDAAFAETEQAELFRPVVKSVQFLGNGYELCLDERGNQWVLLSQGRYEVNETLPIYINKNRILKFA